MNNCSQSCRLAQGFSQERIAGLELTPAARVAANDISNAVTDAMPICQGWSEVRAALGAFRDFFSLGGVDIAFYEAACGSPVLNSDTYWEGTSVMLREGAGIDIEKPLTRFEKRYAASRFGGELMTRSRISKKYKMTGK